LGSTYDDEGGDLFGETFVETGHYETEYGLEEDAEGESILGTEVVGDVGSRRGTG
jgi:hypothetical protein